MAQKATPETSAKADAPEAETTDKKVLYRLTRGYWDNRVLHKAGDELYFAEGTAPKGSILVE